MSSARKATGERVMPKLAKIDRETAKAIEEAMFVFENLLEMDDKNLGTFIRNVDGDVLTTALKVLDACVRNRFLGSISHLASAGIRSHIQSPAPFLLTSFLYALTPIFPLSPSLPNFSSFFFFFFSP